MPEKNYEPGKATNGKKQKCITHICDLARCPFPRGAYVARITPAGAQIETGGTKGWNDVWRGTAGTVMGIASYELTVTASLICDVSTTSSRYVLSLPFSSRFPADAIYSPLYPFFSKVIPLFLDATPFSCSSYNLPSFD